MWEIVDYVIKGILQLTHWRTFPVVLVNESLIDVFYRRQNLPVLATFLITRI